MVSCDVWQREAEDANRKATIAEQQRDEVSNIFVSFKVQFTRWKE